VPSKEGSRGSSVRVASARGSGIEEGSRGQQCRGWRLGPAASGTTEALARRSTAAASGRS
jgi:hypothetical protein